MSTLRPDSFGAYQRRVERISQSVVRVDLRNKIGGFEEIRNLVLNWLREKAGSGLTDAMLRGETDSLDMLGAQRVETVALKDPQLWAARQDFQDDRVARRTWVTEAMLAQPHEQMALLGFRLHCVTLGEPAPFSRSIPRFMREAAILHNVWLDAAEIDTEAQRVDSEEETDALVRLLVDTKRRSPVIGISMEECQPNDRLLVDPDRLARAVFGAAHVRVLSRNASFWLTDKIGKRFSVFNGALRIWWPNFLPDRADAYDHPLWLAEHVRDAGDARIRAVVADLLLKVSAKRRDADDAIPSFAEARRVAAKISRELAADSGRSAEDLIKLYEEENKQLLEVLNDLKAEHAEFVILADDELRLAVADRDNVRSEVYALRSRLEEMERAIKIREQVPIIEIPDNFDQLAAWAALYTGTTIELLPRAINAAKKSIFDNPRVAYQTLLLLNDAYVPMRRSGSHVARERWESGLKQLGLECTQTHSGTRAGENPNDYYVTYAGRKREIDMHLKGSNSRDPRYCFRVYFFWDDESERVVVASLPSHLDTRIT